MRPLFFVGAKWGEIAVFPHPREIRVMEESAVARSEDILCELDDDWAGREVESIL